MTTAHIFDVQKFSVHDGPGIRTLVFFKGCPLRCRWCANPEGQRHEPELLFLADRCGGCAACVDACPHGAHRVVPGEPSSHAIDRRACVGCGACAGACPAAALRKVGDERPIDDLLDEVLQDELFYRNSGGGVTLGGGDPVGQPEAALELLERCRSRGIHTALETCAFASLETMERLAAHLDLLHIDLKHIDDDAHLAITGQPNAPILRNVERMLVLGLPVVIRMPIVPTINDDPDAMHRAVAWLAQRDGAGAVRRIDLLPYHRLGAHKYAMLGRDDERFGEAEPSDGALEALCRIVSAAGFDVRVESYR